MVTLAEVGHRAGYSRGIVTHHFGTKEALLGAFARVAQGHVRPPAEQEPGLEHLAAAVNAYLVQVRSGDPYVRGFLLLWVESVNAPPELRAIFSERDRFFVDQILGDLDAGVAAGTIAADVDLTATAVALAAQLRGIGLQLIIDPESLDVDHTNEVVRRTLLGALENRNPQTKPRR
jgi:AcrR family transcriptional regulator